MDINLSPIRTTIFLVMIVVFYFLGGFTMPEIEGGLGSRKFNRAWMYCIVMFCAGAGFTTVVDHWVGNIERSNLRIFYIILGVILMATALIWQSTLRGQFTPGEDEISWMLRQAPIVGGMSVVNLGDIF